MIAKIKSLKNHQGFKKYLFNTNWLFLEKVFRLSVSFFVGIYIARYLGPEKFGMLNYAISFVYLFGAIAGLGLRSILVRELVKGNRERVNQLLGTGFVLQTLGAIVLVLTVNASGALVNTEDIYFYLILFISLGMLFQSFQVIDFYFQSKVLSKHTVKVHIAVVAIVNLFKLYLVFVNADLLYFAMAYFIESFILAIGFVLVYKKQKLNIFDWRFDKSVALSLLKDSWPLMLSGIVVNIYMKIDQVMIKHFLGATEVGLYAVAARLVEAWYFIPTILSASLSPAVINAHKKSLKLFNQRLVRLYSFYTWLSIIITLFMVTSASFLITLLFGEAYSGGVATLQIYALSTIATFVGMSTSQYLIAKNLTKISFYRTLIGMIVNVLLNIILIPRYGIEGAAVATVLSYGIATATIFLFKDARNQYRNLLKSFNPQYITKGK